MYNTQRYKMTPPLIQQPQGGGSRRPVAPATQTTTNQGFNPAQMAQMYKGAQGLGKGLRGGFGALQQQAALQPQAAAAGLNPGGFMANAGIGPQTQAQMLAAQDVGMAGAGQALAPETMAALTGEAGAGTAGTAATGTAVAGTGGAAAAGGGAATGGAAALAAAPWLIPVAAGLGYLFFKD